MSGDYLFLRSVRLRANAQWNERGEGLSFVFPRCGMGNFVSRRFCHKLTPGDVLVMNRSAGWALVPAGDSELACYCFCLCLEDLLPLLGTAEMCLLPAIAERLRASRVHPAGGELARECHQLVNQIPTRQDPHHRAQLLRVAAYLLAVEFKRMGLPRNGCRRTDGHMTRILGGLSPGELMSLSVGDLARRFNCSRRHLNRLFQRRFGRSVTALRMEWRLLKARSLLRDPDAKVLNVAEQCGFNHLGLFHGCFKRRFGRSPGQCRDLKLREDKGSCRHSPGEAGCAMRLSGLCPWSGNHNHNGAHTGNGVRHE